MNTLDPFPQPDELEASQLRKARALMELFRVLHPGMPASYISAFLSVAEHPGQGVTEHAQRLGMLRPVASRILLEIGKKARTGEPGFDLVASQQSWADLRAVHYMLTPRGTRLKRRVLDILERGSAT